MLNAVLCFIFFHAVSYLICSAKSESPSLVFVFFPCCICVGMVKESSSGPQVRALFCFSDEPERSDRIVCPFNLVIVHCYVIHTVLNNPLYFVAVPKTSGFRGFDKMLTNFFGFFRKGL